MEKFVDKLNSLYKEESWGRVDPKISVSQS